MVNAFSIILDSSPDFERGIIRVPTLRSISLDIANLQPKVREVEENSGRYKRKGGEKPPSNGWLLHLFKCAC